MGRGRVILLCVTAILFAVGAVLTAVVSGSSSPQGQRGAVAAELSLQGRIGAAERFLSGPERSEPTLAWVDVPVATLWTQPSTSRPEDAAAIGPKPDVAGWVAGMSVDQKLELDDLLNTQVLMDEQVFVVSTSGAWSQIVVPDQRGSVYPDGVAGWVPSAQLTTTPPPASDVQVTVAVPSLRAGSYTLSYGTSVPAHAAGRGSTTLLLPGGPVAVASSSVRQSRLAPSGAAVVSEARRFLGLQYLWAGTSAFGFDCSGLTYTVYRQFGIELPRDAADQAAAGRPVAVADLQPGDLVFFAFEPTIDHVGIYAGNGMMIDAPHTGAAIEVVKLSTLMRWYAGGRRYL